MSLSRNNKVTQRILFSSYAYIAGPMGDVFQYLLRSDNHSKLTGKKMGLRAISAFWKPFSAQAVLKVDEQAAREIALNSISELEDQIELIKKAFNIQHGYLPSLTRQDVEQLIDIRINQQRQELERQQQFVSGSVAPTPDHYNERSRRATH